MAALVPLPFLPAPGLLARRAERAAALRRAMLGGESNRGSTSIFSIAESRSLTSMLEADVHERRLRSATALSQRTMHFTLMAGFAGTQESKTAHSRFRAHADKLQRFPSFTAEK